MSQNSVVRARINVRTKKKAAAVFAKHGLTVSDAIRLLLTLTAKTDAVPISFHVPNQKTKKAMKTARTGKTTKAESIEDLFKQLNA